MWECFKRSLTPFLMYMFCSMIALVCLNIPSDGFKAVLVGFFILLGAVFNADLSMGYGKDNYKMLLTGNIRRANEIDTVLNNDRKSYRREREYSPYKGFLIGAMICIPVVIVCLIYFLSGVRYQDNAIGGFVLLIISGWAILPWQLAQIENVYLTLISCILPILVTGIFYIIGAMREKKNEELKKKRMEEAERMSNRERKKLERENRKFK